MVKLSLRTRVNERARRHAFCTLSLLHILLEPCDTTTWADVSDDAAAGHGVYDAYFINSEIGWVVGADGIIFHTQNGGNNWVEQNRGHLSYKAVSFVSATHGWVVGSSNSILITQDGGQTWEQNINVHGTSGDIHYDVQVACVARSA
eukprot:gene28776-35719_t